jgi:hypothetical protein
MFCCICRDDIKDDEYLKTDCCKQDFHRECLVHWLIRSPMCPLCRLHLDPKTVADDMKDLPVYSDEALWWFISDDILHRENGPAYIDDKGNKEWYYQGRLHREGGPAGEYSDGCKQWWRYGYLHREDGPAIECEDGHKEWWVNGERHRVDGPALIAPGKVTQWWYKGRLHRVDGPAVLYDNGQSEIWINGSCKSCKKSISLLERVFTLLK